MAEKKKYIEVEIPMLGSSMRILGNPDEIENKTIKLDLTRRLRGKGLTITFRLFKHEGKMVAIPNKLELVKAYIRRMMRKRVDYVEDSFRVQCVDVSAVVKPFLITRKKVSRAIRKNLRNTSREFILEYIKEKDFCEMCNELKNGVMQKAMLPKLKKVYPLSFCEIRIFETKELSKIDLNKASKKEEEDAQEYFEEEASEGSSDKKEE
jgi:ribosomal protein S3AE